MSFFADEPEPEPARPTGPEYRPPEWSSPPENVMPASVPLDVALARSDDLAAWIGDAAVYPTGVALHLTIMRRRAPQHPQAPFVFHPGGPAGPRFGVGFSDGRRTTLNRPPAVTRPDIAIIQSGGGGSDRYWAGRLWLWPLPPAGPVTFAFAWPEEGIQETTVDLNADSLIAAAGRARVLWPDDRPPFPEDPAGGWVAYT